MNHKSLGFRLCIILVCSAFFINGCAAIAGGGTSQPIDIDSAPSGAHFIVKSSSGIQMAEGTTPQTVRLPRKNEYQVDFSMDGYKTQSVSLIKSTNGWVWGNLVIGGIVGFVIDFATGAAYKLEPAIVKISLETVRLESGKDALFATIRLLNKKNDVLEEQSVQMEPVSPDTSIDTSN